MGEVITAKDKEYEAEERATAPGANQSMSDRVNNRSLRPQSAAFKEFMKSGWADDDPEINPLESSKFTPARLEALGKAFPGERLVIPAGQPKVRNNDCDYMFRPDTTFAYYTGLGSDYEAGAVLVLNPVDPDSPEAAAGKTHTPELFVAPRADNSTEDFFMSAHYGEYWVGPRAGLKEMQAMTGIETHDIAQLADALSKDVGAEAGAVARGQRDRSRNHLDGRVHPRGQRFRRSGQELRIRRQAARVRRRGTHGQGRLRNQRNAQGRGRHQAWLRPSALRTAGRARQAALRAYPRRRVQRRVP